MAFFFARQEDNFQKRICPKRTFYLDFVKLGSTILYLFLAGKNGRLFVRFWLTLKKIVALGELRKMPFCT